MTVTVSIRPDPCAMCEGPVLVMDYGVWVTGLCSCGDDQRRREGLPSVGDVISVLNLGVAAQDG